jgi:hypothetical protein
MTSLSLMTPVSAMEFSLAMTTLSRMLLPVMTTLTKSDVITDIDVIIEENTIAESDVIFEIDVIAEEKLKKISLMKVMSLDRLEKGRNAKVSAREPQIGPNV